MIRYHRQTLLPEIGEEGQYRLQKARVLIVGVGGLGCPIATYLCGAGVGHLGLIDDDVVSLSNLHRQVLYTESDVGQPKVTCAARHLRRLNSDITIDEYPFRLTNESGADLIRCYDMVIDGCDNFSTRYLISDLCSTLHIPYIYGAITALSGQVAILCHGENAATYRTLFPERAEGEGYSGKEATSSPSPVIGPTPAIIGSVQAAEAIKFICQFGEPLVNKLWNIDLLTMQTCIISIQ